MHVYTEVTLKMPLLTMHIPIANVQYIFVKFSIIFLKGNICLPYFFYLREKCSQLPFDPCIKTEYLMLIHSFSKGVGNLLIHGLR